MYRDLHCTNGYRFTGSGIEISRRHLLGTAVLLPLATPLPVYALQPEKMRIGDAHAHMFNAADLPMAGFAKYVLAGGMLGNRWITRAVVDVLTGVAGRFAVGARAEREALGNPTISGAQSLSAAQFGEEVANLADERLSEGQAEGATQEQRELAEGYRELSQAAVADASYTPGLYDVHKSALMRMKTNDADAPGLARYVAQSNALSFQRVAEKAENPAMIDPGEVLEQRLKQPQWQARILSGDLPPDRFPSLWKKALQTLGWAKRMLESRSDHLDSYLRQYNGEDHRTVVMINNLVDYDMWLDDTPRSDSGHGEQIEFYHALAAKRRDQVDIRTFAGYCPLKHAIQLRSGSAPWFDDLKAYWTQSKIAGFKLYPPMGFHPWGNSDLPDSDFDPRPRSRVTAIDQWRRVAGDDRLGPALDDALGRFYEFCVEQDVPIMAHAGSGNEAGPMYGQRANPKYWEQVVARYPLRLSLGHVVNEAIDLVNAPDDDDGTDVWFLDASRRLLRPDLPGSAQVYGDLSFMPELVFSPTLARDFFVKLRNLMANTDPDMTRIVYGTDWIMLARQAYNHRMYRAALSGMRAAGYSPEMQENILHRNLERFLSREA